MSILQNIATVSKYERKTLYRSWFFRIFSIISLLFLFGINIGNFGFHGGIKWTTRAIAANLPYINVLFINVVQAIIAVFLASDFLKRDKKLDTTEVIYTRPITNGEYVVGKTMGILSLFIGLVIIALAMALMFNIIRPDVPVVWKAYLYYPLLINLPTLIFILGLSFFLMILIKNQAVTFIILLGYIGLTLFYFKDKMHGTFDYMAFNLPMVYSDFIGFGEPYRIVLHRLAYFFMGLGFIFATIRYLNRLPQTGKWNSVNLIAFIGFVAFGGLLGFKYFSIYQQEDKNRVEFLALNNRYASTSFANVVSNEIHVIQKGKNLQISSEISLTNRNNIPLDTIIFSLNPGFHIDSIISDEQAITCTKNQQILQIIPREAIAFRDSSQFTLYYSGIPVETIAYLDISDENLAKVKRIQVATLDKKPGIVTADFVLLTSELLWYPVSGVSFNNKTFMPKNLDFTKFELFVKPNEDLTVIAPGEVEVGDGEYHFIPEEGLSSLPLVIGQFEKKSAVYGEVEYNTYIMPGHDFFSEFFTNITDTIGALILEEKNDYEIDELDLYYPFKRINLVEVPIQFHAYDRPQIQTIETLQPEIILFPEKGAGLDPFDFARYKYYEERRNRKENDTRTPAQIETKLFERFIKNLFFRHSTSIRGSGENRNSGPQSIINFQGVDYSKNPYAVFPLYYSYVTGVSSYEYPLFNSMLEIYLKEGFAASMRQTFIGGMTDSEKANLALRDNSITEIFEVWDNTISSALVSQTGAFIFLALKNKVGMSEFDNFLYYYLEDNNFREISFNQFSRDFYNEFNVKIEPYFETLNTKGKIPTFIMSTPDYFQTRDEIGEVYILKFGLRNTGEVKGLVEVSIRVSGGSDTPEQRLYELDPGITKDIQIVLYDQPRMLTVNTLISGNIPSTYGMFLRSAREIDKMDMEEYEKITEKELSLVYKDEYVVDNEDSGFNYFSVSNESKLKQYIDSKKQISEEIFYGEMRSERTPHEWTPVAHSAFYGETVRSALVTRSGDGGNIASWSTVLPASGFYDVYVFVPVSAMMSRGTHGRGKGEGGRRGGPQFADSNTKYNYVISSNEGTEDVEYPLRNAEEGWNKVGSFHFPADTAKIELSNRTNGNRVIADAVKWVRR